MFPSSVTSATVCRSPIRPWSSIAGYSAIIQLLSVETSRPPSHDHPRTSSSATGERACSASELHEGTRVDEGATHRRVVGGEGEDLEVRDPLGERRLDAVLGGGSEPEPRVVRGITEDGDQWFAPCLDPG